MKDSLNITYVRMADYILFIVVLWGTPRDNTQQCIRDGRFPFRKKKKVDENKLIYQYNIGIPRKDILEEFRISTKLLYSILRKHNVKLRKS